MAAVKKSHRKFLASADALLEDIRREEEEAEERHREIFDDPDYEWHRDYTAGEMLLARFAYWHHEPDRAARNHVKGRHAEGERDAETVLAEALEIALEVYEQQPEDYRRWYGCNPLYHLYRKPERKREIRAKAEAGEEDDYAKAWREGIDSAWRAKPRRSSVVCSKTFPNNGCWRDFWGICEPCGSTDETTPEGWTIHTGRGKTEGIANDEMRRDN